MIRKASLHGDWRRAGAPVYATPGIARAVPWRLKQRMHEILDDRRYRRGTAWRHVLMTLTLVALAAVPAAIITGEPQAHAQTPSHPPAKEAAPANPPPAAPNVPSWHLWSPQATDCAVNGQCLGLAILNYASQHRWQLPPDLGATLPYMQKFDPESRTLKTVLPAEAARYYLCPLDQGRIAVPAAPTPEWINRNTSYAYLGGADVNVDALTPEQFDSAAIMHEKSADIHPEMSGNPMAFSLGGGYGQPESAERIAWSRQVLDATRGTPSATVGQPRLAQLWARVQAAPSASQCARNQVEIRRAIAIYQNFNKGYYPATLGDTLPYALKYIKHTNPLTGQDESLTPEQAARIYLCPLEQDIEIPEDVTPEWVNEHTSYVYLGDENLTEVADTQAVLLYEGLDRGHGDDVTMAFLDGHVQGVPKEQAQALIDRSIVMLDADRAREADRLTSNGGNGAAAAADGTTSANGTAGGTSGRAAGRGGRPRTPADANAQRLESLRRLTQVLVEDTRSRKERLPEDLLDVFKFTTQSRPTGPPALSPQVAARLLLSPRALKNLKVPAKPTRQWLEDNVSYAYLGDERLTVGLMQARIPAARWAETVLVHEKPVEGDPWVAVATLDLGCRLMEADKAKALIEDSKRTLAEARMATAPAIAGPAPSTQPAASNKKKHPAERWRGGRIEIDVAGPATRATEDRVKATGAAGTPPGTAVR